MPRQAARLTYRTVSAVASCGKCACGFDTAIYTGLAVAGNASLYSYADNSGHNSYALGGPAHAAGLSKCLDQDSLPSVDALTTL